MALVSGVNVIGIYVTDLKRALHFYQEQLGLSDEGEQGPGRMMRAGKMLIYIEPGRKNARTAGDSSGEITVCFSSESIKSAFDELQQQQLRFTMDYTEFTEDFAMFIVQDPDGNNIEFAGKP
jgi:catechol 2,3-dioxygenase-like lactoylglutathione lyase family enzyme